MRRMSVLALAAVLTGGVSGATLGDDPRQDVDLQNNKNVAVPRGAGTANEAPAATNRSQLATAPVAKPERAAAGLPQRSPQLTQKQGIQDQRLESRQASAGLRAMSNKRVDFKATDGEPTAVPGGVERLNQSRAVNLAQPSQLKASPLRELRNNSALDLNTNVGK